MPIDGGRDYDYRSGARLFFPEFESIGVLAARFLESMEEPSFAGGIRTVEAYRFLWLRTRHPPIAVRAVLSPSPGRLVAKVLDEKGYDPFRLKTKVERELTDSESRGLREVLEVTGFWQLGVKDNRMGLDGANWILEGLRPAGHHVVIRWSPPEAPDTPSFRAACEYLLRCANLGPDAKPIY